MNYDVEVSWQINDICNFDCNYCWLQTRKGYERFAGINDMQKVVDGFDRTGRTWLIHMSGGEPFLSPNFVGLCQELTKKHFISINTNLVHKDVYAFAETIDPARVDFLHCSLHIGEREKQRQVEDFIKKYNALCDKGFYVFASYLMYPGLMKKFPGTYERFKNEGIVLRPKVFWGDEYGIFKFLDSKLAHEFNYLVPVRDFVKKTYPEAFTKKQRELIRAYVDKSDREEVASLKEKQGLRKRTIDLRLDKNWYEHLVSFKGDFCHAGSKFVKMDQYGGVTRCNDEGRHQLGNMFDGELKLFDASKVCTADICSCPYVGFRYTFKKEEGKVYA